MSVRLLSVTSYAAVNDVLAAGLGEALSVAIRSCAVRRACLGPRPSRRGRQHRSVPAVNRQVHD